MNNKTKTYKFSGDFYTKVEDFNLLIKLRLTLLVVFTAVLAGFLAFEGGVDWQALGILAIGGFCITGAANALNEVLEKDYDILMARTENRPLPQNRMKVSDAVLLAGFMALIGITILALFNPWTALLGTIALISYAFVYTPLKRKGPIAVYVGAVPGALPVLIGYVAISGEITWFAISLFILQFLWQFPHFWSIAWLKNDEYTKAGFRLLPSKHGTVDRETGRQCFLMALMLLPVLGLLYSSGDVSIVAILLVTILSLVYIAFSFDFFRKNTKTAALKVMFGSFLYLPLSLLALLI